MQNISYYVCNRKSYLILLLVVVMRGYVAYQLVGCGLGHSLVGALAGVQVIATVEAIGKGLGIGGAAHGSIKIDTAIKKWVRCATTR